MTTTHQQILALLHERWPGEVPKGDYDQPLVYVSGSYWWAACDQVNAAPLSYNYGDALAELAGLRVLIEVGRYPVKGDTMYAIDGPVGEMSPLCTTLPDAILSGLRAIK